jgi:hypothetical protein
MSPPPASAGAGYRNRPSPHADLPLQIRIASWYTLSASGTPAGSGKVVLTKQLYLIRGPDALLTFEKSRLAGRSGGSCSCAGVQPVRIVVTILTRSPRGVKSDRLLEVDALKWDAAKRYQSRSATTVAYRVRTGARLTRIGGGVGGWHGRGGYRLAGGSGNRPRARRQRV